MSVTQQEFDSAFPNGVALFRNATSPVSDLVDLEVREVDGATYVRGWSYPHKDFVFVLDGYTETDNGWWVETLDGAKAFLSPLTPERQQRMLSLLDEE